MAQEKGESWPPNVLPSEPASNKLESHVLCPKTITPGYSAGPLNSALHGQPAHFQLFMHVV